MGATSTAFARRTSPAHVGRRLRGGGGEISSIRKAFEEAGKVNRSRPTSHLSDLTLISSPCSRNGPTTTIASECKRMDIVRLSEHRIIPITGRRRKTFSYAGRSAPPRAKSITIPEKIRQSGTTKDLLALPLARRGAHPKNDPGARHGQQPPVPVPLQSHPPNRTPPGSFTRQPEPLQAGCTSNRRPLRPPKVTSCYHPWREPPIPRAPRISHGTSRTISHRISRRNLPKSRREGGRGGRLPYPSRIPPPSQSPLTSPCNRLATLDLLAPQASRPPPP